MAEIDWDELKSRLQSFGIFIYFVVGAIVAGTVSYVLYTRFNKQVAAVLVFMAMMLALYYYYVKWFVIGDEFLIPTTNCPDLMTAVKVIDNKYFVCADTNGVYGNKSTVVATDDIASPNDTEKKSGRFATIANGSYILTPDPDLIDVPGYCALLNKNNITHIGTCKTLLDI